MIDIFDAEMIAGEIGNDAGAGASGLPAYDMARMLPDGAFAALVEQSGLTGKGGAHFPTHRKINFIRQQKASDKVLIINGGEHEPGSEKDRYLLENYADTVVEGALILAHAIDAETVVIAIGAHAVLGLSRCAAVIERAKCILFATRAGRPISVFAKAVPDSYLVGEESALIEVLEGREALPRQRPPFPIEQGFRGRPTLVQNVETVAHLPYIVAAGAERYRALGRHGAGVTLCTYGPEFSNAGVRLVPLGGTLREIVEDYGGGLATGDPIKAVQPGGPAAGILTEDELDVVFDSQSLRKAGSALGCAAIRGFSRNDSIVTHVAESMAFFADASCGQCPSCRMETNMLNSIMKQTIAGQAGERLLAQVPVVIANAAKKPAICGLVQMPAAPMLSALSKFPQAFQNAASGGEL